MLQAEIVREKAPHPIPTLGRNGKVLVVDDSRSVREILAKTLSFWGYDVTLAANGIEAGRLFFTGSYDLVITDLEMPLMDGWELSRLIKERSPNTPVMVVSGAVDKTHWEKMDRGFVDAIVPKPLSSKRWKGRFGGF